MSLCGIHLLSYQFSLLLHDLTFNVILNAFFCQALRVILKFGPINTVLLNDGFLF